MAMIAYADQHPDALFHALCVGEVDLQRFNVLSTGTLVGPQYTVTVGILGASHFVRVAHAWDALTEIFACTGSPITPSRVSSPLADVLDHPVERTEGELTYRFSADVLTNNRRRKRFDATQAVDDFTDLLAPSISDQQVGLSFEFPHPRERLPFLPVTMVHAQVNRAWTQLTIRTVHAYPDDNDGSAVLTRTLIHFGGTST